jgi:hypothetical protein
MNKLFKQTTVAILLVVFSAGCESILEPSVDQALPIDTAINTVQDLRGFVLGAHDRLNATALYGRDMVAGVDVATDNAFSNGNSGRFLIQSQLQYTPTNGYSSGIWNTMYAVIANANIVINSDITGDGVDYVKGQAYAIRALAHFNLILFFGQQWVSGGDANLGVPYVTTYAEGNNYPQRDPIATVWTNIVSDLAQAESLMNPAQNVPVTQINYWAVKGLQSRVHLYTGDFAAAIAAADAVINSGRYSLTPSANLATAWAARTGPNSLFEMAFSGTDNPGFDNLARIYNVSNYGDVEATADLYNAYDASDARRGLMTDYGNGRYRLTGKYVDVLTGTDNVRVIRFEEVWLNKAEALARRNSGNDRNVARDMINTLSAGRGSSRVYDNGEPLTVLAERRLELAFEGHRFFDLARHGLSIPNPPIPAGFARFNSNSSALSFGDFRFALPIPDSELNANSNMVQNSGY